MAVTFNKPKGLKYTDMCIYIDKNLPLIVEQGKNPTVEDKIYEYLYHIVYALARKGMYFRHFKDYDEFALFAAGDFFMKLRKKQRDAGKVIRGKEVKPVKSCLNYIKAVIYPFKVNYQNASFSGVFNPEVGYDTGTLNSILKDKIRTSYNSDLETCFTDNIKRVPQMLLDILKRSPYRNDKILIHKLYMSCIMTLIDEFTLKNSVKRRLGNQKFKGDLHKAGNFEKAYLANKSSENPIMWHLEESGLEDYVKFLVRKIKLDFSKELHEDIHKFDLSDNLIDDIISSSYLGSTEPEEEGRN